MSFRSHLQARRHRWGTFGLPCSIVTEAPSFVTCSVARRVCVCLTSHSCFALFVLHASSGDGAGAIGDGAGGVGATGDGAGGAGATGDGAGGVGATRLAGNSRVEGHDGVEHESKELNALLCNLEAEIATIQPERRYRPRTCSASDEQADIRRELASSLATGYDDGGGDEYNALAEDMEIGSHTPEETAAKEAGGAHGVVLPDEVDLMSWRNIAANLAEMDEVGEGNETAAPLQGGGSIVTEVAIDNSAVDDVVAMGEKLSGRTARRRSIHKGGLKDLVTAPRRMEELRSISAGTGGTSRFLMLGQRVKQRDARRLVAEINEVQGCWSVDTGGMNSVQRTRTLDHTCPIFVRREDQEFGGGKDAERCPFHVRIAKLEGLRSRRKNAEATGGYASASSESSLGGEHPPAARKKARAEEVESHSHGVDLFANDTVEVGGDAVVTHAKLVHTCCAGARGTPSLSLSPPFCASARLPPPTYAEAPTVCFLGQLSKQGGMVIDGAGKARRARRSAYDKHLIMAIVRPLARSGVLDLNSSSAVKGAQQELSHYLRPGNLYEDRVQLATAAVLGLRREVSVDDTHSVPFAQVLAL